MNEFGKATLNLDNLIKEKGISKTQLSYKAEISHTQINRFCKNDVTRIDLNTIARLCHVLDCNVSDLILYEPPSE
ncbi:MAG: helix-turn-helix transcriptional regulator [Lachnospiraceae bacterium]|nr:helix-turn-helix transcriptional regulator [Lachnospiraceae bacterium]MBQ7832507.1 helix-turn-helix transcriptional regulator [Lachnospiraceae bacterium]